MKEFKVGALLCTGAILVAGCTGNGTSTKEAPQPSATVTEEVHIEDEELVVPYACQNLAIFVGATERLTNEASDLTDKYQDAVEDKNFSKAQRLESKLQNIFEDLTNRVSMSNEDKVHCLEAGEAVEEGMDPHKDAGKAGEGHEEKEEEE